MATDWAADVKKYVADADDAAIAGIVRYLGIALRNRDSALVSFSDKTETDRVRNNFLKKKLGLTQADATLDKAIAKVGEVLKADRTKNRVTVYYLLAAEFKKLSLFVKADAKKAPAAKAPAAKAPAAKAADTKAATRPAVAGSAVSAKTSPKPAAKTAAKPASAKPASAKPVATKAGPAKAAPAKAAAKLTAKKAPAKTQGLMGGAAKAAPKAEKPATGAVAGTIAAGAAVTGAAVAAASGAAEAAKEPAAKTMGSVGDAAGAVAGAAGNAADKVGDAIGAAGNAASAAADKASTLFAPGSKPSGSDSADGGMGWLLWLVAAALLLFALWWILGSGGNDGEAINAAPTEAAATLDATAEGSAATDSP